MNGRYAVTSEFFPLLVFPHYLRCNSPISQVADRVSEIPGGSGLQSSFLPILFVGFSDCNCILADFGSKNPRIDFIVDDDPYGEIFPWI